MDILQRQKFFISVVSNVWENDLLYKERLNYGVRFGLKLKNDDKYINNVYAKITSLIGIENAKILFNEYRGQQVTFPVEFYKKEYIYSEIIAEYDGKNIKELAKKYNYSEHTIRRIINKNLSE